MEMHICSLAKLGALVKHLLCGWSAKTYRTACAREYVHDEPGVVRLR
jgi:hypothetical protein